MKKLLVLTLLTIPLIASASDFLTPTTLEWKDFAPPAFADVKQPKGLGRLNVTAKYWYDRRVSFNEAVAACDELTEPDEKYGCYEKVKVTQYAANSEYNARLEAKSTPQVPGMQNPTDNMLQVGSYIDQITRNMPNEFR